MIDRKMPKLAGILFEIVEDLSELLEENWVRMRYSFGIEGNA